MEHIKEIIDKKKYNNIPCPKCNADQGRFVPRGTTSWFECYECGFDCLRANYAYERKQYHKREDELVIEEVKF